MVLAVSLVWRRALTSHAGPGMAPTVFTSDGRGNRLSATDPTGRVTRWTYNSFDQVTSVSTGETTSSTAAVVTSTVTYNALGQPTVAVDAAGTAVESTSTFVYDPVHPSDLVGVVDGRGKSWTYGYDPATGDVVAATDPLGATETMVYNNVGWVVGSVSAKGNETGATPADWETSFVHDAWGRVIESTNPAGDRVRSTFDANGNLVSVETGLSATVTTGDVTSYTYDSADQLVGVDPPGPGAKSYSYTADGARLSFTNENSGTWTYGYDGLGRLVSSEDPGGAVTGYGFDAASRLAWVAQPGGTCTAPKTDCASYSYDEAGRVTGVDYSDPATADLSGFVYDGLGRRTAVTQGAATESWSWDAQSRLVSHLDVNGRTTGYGWDATSNLVSITYPGQSVPLTRSFDDAGRLSSATDWSGRATSFGYDGNGNWTDTVFPTGSQNTDVRTYDVADRLVGVTWKRGSTVLGSLDYGPRDPKGMVTAVTGSGAAAGLSNSWVYDSRDRLTSTTTDNLGFDPATNLIDRDGVLQVFDPAQRLCWTSPTATGGDCVTPASDATTFDYDARGNRTAMAYPSGTTAAYSFDGENRMVEARLPSPFSSGVKQLETLPATRIADTTAGTGVCDAATCVRLSANDPVTVQVAGQGGVPASGVAAVLGTVTVTGGGGDGWLSVNPNGDAAGAVVAVQTGTVGTTSFTAQLDGSGQMVLESTVGVEVAVDVAGYYLAPSLAGVGANYWPTTPALVADPSGTGTCDGVACGPITGATDIDVSGVAAIPADVSAVTVSVLASTASTAGVLRVAPNGVASAGELVWDAGFAVAAGQFTVPVNSDGTITVETDTATNVTVSVTGWWRTPTSSADAGTGLKLLDGAQRPVDTRDGTGTCDNTACDSLVGLAPAVKIAVAGQAGLDPDVAAVVLSITVHDPVSAGLVAVGPTPGVASAMLVLNAEMAASVTVPVDPASGTIAIGSWMNTDVTVDVIGGFTQPQDTYTYHYDTTGLRSAKQLEGGWRDEYTWTAHGGLPLLIAEHRGTAAPRPVMWFTGLVGHRSTRSKTPRSCTSTKTTKAPPPSSPTRTAPSAARSPTTPTARSRPTRSRGTWSARSSATPANTTTTKPATSTSEPATTTPPPHNSRPWIR